MSLAWPEPLASVTPFASVTDIYLGRRLAVVARAGQASVLVRYAPTLPLERVLALLHQGAQAQLGQSHALRVRLGAAFCPPVSFPVPRHISRWRELHAWARQSAADVLDTDPAQLMVDSDHLHHGLAAALPRAVHDALQTWAISHRLAIRSLCPLWSDATRCGQARRAHELWVQEPDGLIRLPAASCEPADAPLPMLLDALAPGSKVTALVLRPQVAARRCTKGPSFLAMHWEAVHAP